MTTVTAHMSQGKSSRDRSFFNVFRILSARNNGYGIVGVVPGTTIWVVKVLSFNGVGSAASVMAGYDSWQFSSSHVLSDSSGCTIMP